MALEFGLQLSRFDWPGRPASTAATLADFARAAEDGGFTSFWLMDHFMQSPFVEGEWEDMLESYTTLGFLAGVTSSIRLGTLVTGITYRNVAHLAKIIATLDVLSGGRAMCGLGAAFWELEHRRFGWEFPSLRERYRRLEDALELLPLMWGPATPSFQGRTLSVDEAVCYPRPIQDHIPLLIGGMGERHTLRLVARYADACNLFGSPAVVREKVAVLREHCIAENRDFASVTVSHLAQARVVKAGEPRLEPHDATVGDLVDRYRELEAAGVQMAIVGVSDAAGVSSVIRLAEVVSAFQPSKGRNVN